MALSSSSAQALVSPPPSPRALRSLSIPRSGGLSFGMAFKPSSFELSSPKTPISSPSPRAMAVGIEEDIRFSKSSNERAHLTHYQALEVSPSADMAEIRSSYRRLALQFHPDVVRREQMEVATVIFSQINEAYAVLSDPQKKAVYDFQIAQECSPVSVSSCWGVYNGSSNFYYPVSSNGPFYTPSAGSPFYASASMSSQNRGKSWETDQCW